MQRTETHKSQIEYDGKGLVIVTLREDAEIDLKDALEIREATYAFHKGKPHVTLIITGQRSTASEEAKKHSAQNPSPGRIAQAILISSLPVRLLGNFYLKFYKPNSLTRLFDEKEAALKWLRETLEEEQKKKLSSQFNR